MTTAFDAQILPEDQRRRRGDAAASHLSLPDVPRSGCNPLEAYTSRRHPAATPNKNLGLIRHDGIARRSWSDYGIILQSPVRWAA